jgi:hypothetical protein
MRPEATLGAFEKPEGAASSFATPMSGGCRTLPSQVPLHYAKNKFNNVNRHKLAVIVNA